MAVLDVTIACAEEFAKPVRRLVESRGMVVADVFTGKLPGAATEGPADLTDAMIIDRDPPQDVRVSDRRAVLVCVCYPRRIAPDVLAAHDVALNFHPAPLPGLRGIHVFEQAVVERRTSFAVTCHTMTPALDAGEILDEHAVEIRDDDTAVALARRAQLANLMLVGSVLKKVAAQWPDPIPGRIQGEGSPATRARVRALCWPAESDDDETLDRKMRAVCFDGVTARFGDRVFERTDAGRDALREWLAAIDESPSAHLI